MRYFFLILCLLAAFSFKTMAQEREKPRANGFVFAATGGRQDTGGATFEFGGGAEGFMYKGLGLGFDIGAIYVPIGISGGAWTGMGTLNGLYNFNPAEKSRFSPYIIAGITLAPRFDTPGGINIGGGLHYWFREHIGLRFEFRDHAFSGMHRHHYYQGRIGIAFR